MLGAMDKYCRLRIDRLPGLYGRFYCKVCVDICFRGGELHDVAIYDWETEEVAEMTLKQWSEVRDAIDNIIELVGKAGGRTQ